MKVSLFRICEQNIMDWFMFIFHTNGHRIRSKCWNAFFRILFEIENDAFRQENRKRLFPIALWQRTTVLGHILKYDVFLDQIKMCKEISHHKVIATHLWYLPWMSPLPNSRKQETFVSYKSALLDYCNSISSIVTPSWKSPSSYWILYVPSPWSSSMTPG